MYIIMKQIDLYKLYQREYEKRLWDYYDNPEIKIDDINNSDDCYKFIMTFLKAGGKYENVVVEELNWLKKYCPQRLKHIVFTFFLGVAFYCNSTYIRNKINAVVKKLSLEDRNESMKKSLLSAQENKICERQYMYMWFMLSLFHDMGYMYEEQKTNTSENNSFELFNQLEIDRIRELCNEIGCEFINPSPFDKNEIIGYNNVIRKGKDHGIYGGNLFYRNLCANRERYLEKIRKNIDVPNLYYGKELDVFFYYIATVITAHNIWLRADRCKICKKKYKECEKHKNCKEYQRYVNYEDNEILRNLIQRDVSQGGVPEIYRIPFHDYPFLYLFDLIDSIEPFKQTNWLTDIQISINERRKEICIKSKDDVYLNRISELKEWLTLVDVKKGKVIIKLGNELGQQDLME